MFYDCFWCSLKGGLLAANGGLRYGFWQPQITYKYQIYKTVNNNASSNPNIPTYAQDNQQYISNYKAKLSVNTRGGCSLANTNLECTTSKQ